MPQITPALRSLLQTKKVDSSERPPSPKGDVIVLPKVNKGQLGVISVAQQPETVGEIGTLTIIDERRVEPVSQVTASIRAASDVGGSWEVLEVPMDGPRNRPATASVQPIRLRATPAPIRDFLAIVRKANEIGPDKTKPRTPPSSVNIFPPKRQRAKSSEPTSGGKNPTHRPPRLPRMHSFGGWEKDRETRR